VWQTRVSSQNQDLNAYLSRLRRAMLDAQLEQRFIAIVFILETRIVM
jgi:DNA-binding winged helix-turn-helix (wHTH) protein